MAKEKYEGPSKGVYMKGKLYSREELQKHRPDVHDIFYSKKEPKSAKSSALKNQVEAVKKNVAGKMTDRHKTEKEEHRDMLRDEARQEKEYYAHIKRTAKPGEMIRNKQNTGWIYKK